MAVAYSAPYTVGTQDGGDVVSYTFSHTNNGNAICIFGYANDYNYYDLSTVSITYNGTPVVMDFQLETGDMNYVYGNTFGGHLLNAASGTHDVTVTATALPAAIYATVISVSGAKTSGAVNAVGALSPHWNNNAIHTHSFNVPSQANDLVIGISGIESDGYNTYITSMNGTSIKNWASYYAGASPNVTVTTSAYFDNADNYALIISGGWSFSPPSAVTNDGVTFPITCAITSNVTLRITDQVQ